MLKFEKAKFYDGRDKPYSYTEPATGLEINILDLPSEYLNGITKLGIMTCVDLQKVALQRAVEAGYFSEWFSDEPDPVKF